MEPWRVRQRNGLLSFMQNGVGKFATLILSVQPHLDSSDSSLTTPWRHVQTALFASVTASVCDQFGMNWVNPLMIRLELQR